MPRLEFRDESHEVEGDEVVVGRHPACEIVVQDPRVSRRHFRLFRDGEDWLVEDTHSRPGTYLNSRAVSCAAKIQHGDRIFAGGVDFVFLDDDWPR